MLLTPRTYELSRIPDKDRKTASLSFFVASQSLKERCDAEDKARKMLLVHQTGSVKLGEVVRYTLTYTPSADRILPSPSHLHVKIKNTSIIALRAAYLHGPYTIHVSAYPSSFNPNRKIENPKRDGVPEFEPNLKAGGSWHARLTVPEDIRDTGGNPSLERAADGEVQSATWIIEISSQILFSSTASVNFELLVARDERSLDLGFAAVTGNHHGTPGQVHDHQQGKHRKEGHPAQPKGIYSKAVKLDVDDTTSLWNKPALPELDTETQQSRCSRDDHAVHSSEQPKRKKQKKIHLVIVSHGLHSNTGADMLYLKESIDAAAKEARENARKRRRAAKKGKEASQHAEEPSTAPLSGGQEDLEDDSEADEDDEQVIVRGFTGNSARTERGIQYLGKRMAKYVLELTYPDQPFMPVKKSVSKKISDTFTPTKENGSDGIPAHVGSSIHQQENNGQTRAYKYTSISFVGHSLGGLVQTYAIAYIYKHSPHFYEHIKPINFVAMASPFLGLSNENPMYVKFALDFGLVGRTGQDLGLTWRAPTLARSGWTAMVSGLGTGPKEHKEPDPGAKPLLRILPTGPAHRVLRMFRNRTVYANVVNDGIVPLRTSCLLFLDWKGLGKVEKARRELGLVGTAMTFGWRELTGQNTLPDPSRDNLLDIESRGTRSGDESPMSNSDDTMVPQPAEDATNEDDEAQTLAEPQSHQFIANQQHSPTTKATNNSNFPVPAALNGLLSFLRPSGKHTKKDTRMFSRSQTIKAQQEAASHQDQITAGDSADEQSNTRPRATRGDSITDVHAGVSAPPKSTIFESAADILNPPVPPLAWLIDPSTRSRTIFHDRVYHPEDIPPPPIKRPGRFGRSFSSDASAPSTHTDDSTEDSGGMRVEEKIARAYHKDLSWRKVLVRLEPDAHNNIVVRRMFANAYGWPVVKHLCDTHFGDTYAAKTRDENEPATDRAKGPSVKVGEDGTEVKGQNDLRTPDRSANEMREAADELAPLRTPIEGDSLSNRSFKLKKDDGSLWDDSYFDVTSDDDEDADDRGVIRRFLSPPPGNRRRRSDISLNTKLDQDDAAPGTSVADIADFLTTSPQPLDGHRGLGLSLTPRPSRSPRDADSIESMHARNPDVNPASKTASALGSTSDVGLRKSIEERINSPSAPSSPNLGRERSGSGGVAEQVARCSFSSAQRPKDIS